MEMAEKDTASFQPQGGSGSASVNFTKREKGRGQHKGHGAKSKFGDKPRSCFRCGDEHKPDTCKFKNTRCFNCNGVGHLSRKCPKPRKTKYTKQVESDSASEDDDRFTLFSVYHTSGKGADKYRVNVQIGTVPINMEIDTGSAVTIISEDIYEKHLSEYPVRDANIRLKSYSGDKISLFGQCDVPVSYQGNEPLTLPLYIAKGNRPPLFGRNWLETIQVNWKQIFTVLPENNNSESLNIDTLKAEYSHVFESASPDIAISGFKAKIRVKDNTQPIFCKSRPVPYSLKDDVERELNRLESNGIIYPVKSSDWASPVVVVPKPDKSIRLCGDYKVTVNRSISEEQYPIPNTEDLFATLAGGKKFTKLDLSQAYTQLELDSDSEDLLTINTHLGLYRYRRLAYGISSAPAIFQSVMDQILAGLPHVVCRIDDILITGADDKSHINTLREVFKRLSDHNIRLKPEKCTFLADQVIYMGHMVNSEGLHATTDKIEAVTNAPSPTNVTELKSYLGLINYYRSFLPNLATVLHPLHTLLRKGENWNWSEQCEEAFARSKQLVVDSDLLVHYDVNKPLKIACDASSYGLGAVISHDMGDGTERPIAFASRSLNDSEKNYSQLEKEALGIVFGVKKFHKYLYGRHFTLITDHKPLTIILGPKKGIPTLAAARLQRWAVTLSAYDYAIVYRTSEAHANCDCLSRLPQQYENDGDFEEVNFSVIDDIPINSRDITEATRKDPVLSKVYEYTLNGWPNHVSDANLKPYFSRKNELGIDHGVVFWGLRVVVPPIHRDRLIDELHEEHIGICRMKSLARSYIWWPNIDEDIESAVKSCAACASVRNSPTVAPLHPWKWAVRPWQRVHIDFADNNNQSYLVVIDSYSKWLEVIPMKSTTSEKTIDQLRLLFCTWGIPEEVVSDNGPQFTSHAFKTFMTLNGVKHTLVPPYHPASNGAAERSVQILKKALKTQVFDAKHHGKNISVEHRLSNFLLKYRTTPHTVTKESPAEMFIKRQLRTRLMMLKPNKDNEISEKQEKMKRAHDKSHAITRPSFEKGEKVTVKTTLPGGLKWKWLPGIIHVVRGPVTYLVKVGNRIRYCHADHLVKSSANFPESYEMGDRQINIPIPRPGVTESLSQPRRTPAAANEPESTDATSGMPDSRILDSPSREADDHSPRVQEKQTPRKPMTFEKRYPTRNRKAPRRLIEN